MPNDGGDLPDRENTNVIAIQEIPTVHTFQPAKLNVIMVVVVVILFGAKRLPLGWYILRTNILIGSVIGMIDM